MPYIAGIIAFAAVTSSTGSAATITDKTQPNGVGIITIEGTLNAIDAKTFQRLALQWEDAVVVMHSDGGNLLAGLKIGEAIRLKEFRTVVPSRGVCASACALAWLGGVGRYMAPDASIGFHAAYVQKDGRAEETGLGNALVGAYLTRLGLPTSSVSYITYSAPNEMQWLTPKDALDIGIEVRVLHEAIGSEPSVTTKRKSTEQGGSPGSGTPSQPVQKPARHQTVIPTPADPPPQTAGGPRLAICRSKDPAGTSIVVSVGDTVRRNLKEGEAIVLENVSGPVHTSFKINQLSKKDNAKITLSMAEDRDRYLLIRAYFYNKWLIGIPSTKVFENDRFILVEVSEKDFRKQCSSHRTEAFSFK